MYLVCFLCAFKIDENVCVHAAFTLSGQHKTDENSLILCIHYYLKQHNYMNRALSKEEQSNIKDYINREFGIYGNRVAGMSIPVKSLAPALGHLNISCRKTGRNSEGKRIIEYTVPDDGIDIEL